jgi:hypothetical protein
MWLFLNDAFLSIVQPPGPGRDLLVRARFRLDIETIFPRAKVTETPSRDYRYRATISREAVANAMADEVRRIAYGNFKGSVGDRKRHDDYLKVWGVMNAAQQRDHSDKKAKGGKGKRGVPGERDPGFWDF